MGTGRRRRHAVLQAKAPEAKAPAEPSVQAQETPPSPIAEARGGVALAGTAFDRVTARIHEFHRAIGSIPFRRMAPLPAVNIGSETVRVVHDAITDGIYASVRGIGRLSFAAADVALRGVERVNAAAPDERAGVSRVRATVISALNGAFGDYVGDSGNPLAIQAGFYRDGRLLALTPQALAQVFPSAGGRIVVLVHGLCCNENAWRGFSGDGGPTYGDRLQDELGYCALYFRYNTGLSIAHNGRRLDDALGKLVQSWPVPVEEIVLIGHSMGGLVIRAAAQRAAHQAEHQAERRAGGWSAKVSHIVCIGSPHLGAPLEKAVAFSAALMQNFELTRPLARSLDGRSRGIRDLRHGRLADHETEPAEELGRIAGVRYHFIGSSLGRSAGDRLGRVFGDGLVPLSSATAAVEADADSVALLGLHHMQLLNHPAVYREIRAWLERG
jgi:pimeloyl-ACP methyl ester carboxylesterase